MLDAALLALRPALDLPPGTTPAERFQNATLRPVLKLQHRRLADVWHRYAQQQKGRFYALGRPAARDYLRHALRTNRALRAYLLGTVTALFTADEWSAYRQNERELARRCLTMIAERLIGDGAVYQRPA